MSNDYQGEMRRLKAREVAGGKFIPFIFITIALLFVQVRVVFWMISIFMRQYTVDDMTDFLYAHPISMRILIVIILLIMIGIGATISIRLLKLISKKVPVELSSEAERRTHRIKTDFKWRRVYTLILAYIVFGVSSMVVKDIVSQFDIIGGINILIFFLCLFIPYVIAFLFLKFFNTFMVRVTCTNVDLIYEIETGFRNSEIPDEYHNQPGILDIVNVLQHADATTVRGAVFVIEAKETIRKITKAIAIIGAALGIIIGLITFGVLSSSVMSGVGSMDSTNTGSSKSSKNANGNVVNAEAEEERRRRKFQKEREKSVYRYRFKNGNFMHKAYENSVDKEAYAEEKYRHEHRNMN